ncbi:MAG: ATP synthase F1 subunit delta [Eubacteriales bacterium]|nr:ATP synthase F1 subunit delta [Eubacteriales bacterium]
MAKLASKVYGDALFQLAVEEQKVDTFLSEIPALETAMEENPELSAIMDHPKIIKEEKIRILEDCFKGRISDELCGLLTLAVEKERYKELPAIFAYTVGQLKEYKKIGVAEVTSAQELDETWKERIEKKLLATTSYRTMEITWRVDPGLLGGMVVRIGDRVVDGSLKFKLTELTGGLNRISLEQNEKVGERAS